MNVALAQRTVIAFNVCFALLIDTLIRILDTQFQFYRWEPRKKKTKILYSCIGRVLCESMLMTSTKFEMVQMDFNLCV